MADVDKIIEDILSKPRFAAKYGPEGKLYRDEPIIFAGRDTQNLTPPRYRAMRKIAEEPAGRRKSAAQIFYEQGKFMEDFEDDYEFQGVFARYFPTYQLMSTAEQRGYFSWRARVRRGLLEKTQSSFTFVYMYELLNQIGVKSTEEGFFSLRDFWRRYRELDYQLDRYARTWLRDYVVYNRLDKSFLDGLDEAYYDQPLLALADHKARSADEIFAGLDSVSSYKLENSRFFKTRRAEFKAVIADVYGRLAEHHEKKCKQKLFEKVFGYRAANHYSMFHSAVFYERETRQNYTYEINPVCRYIASDGHWLYERFFSSGNKNRYVGTLLKNIDFLMRRKYNFKSTLKPPKLSKVLEGIIEAAMTAFDEKRQEAARAAVAIDVSRLGGIRAAALATQNKLIVAEEEAMAEEPAESAPLAPSPPAPLENGARLAEVVTALPHKEISRGLMYGPLTENEIAFLRLIFEGGSSQNFLRERGLMLSIVMDSINEKLFDLFGDTVLIEEEGEAKAIEDYLGDLKDFLRHENT